MNKKFRYLLIGFCFLLFFFLSPLLVMYLSGLKLDLKEKKFIQTGSLGFDVATPGVQILVNGKEVKKGKKNLKFLKPGTYLVNIQKTGYKPWHKNLRVEAGKVTWVNEANKKIYLLYEQPVLISHKPKTLDSYLDNNNLFFVENGKLKNLKIKNLEEEETYNFPENFTAISPTNDSNQLLLNTEINTYIFNTQYRTFTKLFKYLPTKGTKVALAGKDKLFFLSGTTLSSLEIPNGRVDILAQNVVDFEVIYDQLYVLEKQREGFSLSFYENESLFSQTIFSNLPEAEKASLFINPQKEIYLVLDQRLVKPELGVVKNLKNNITGIWQTTNKDEILFQDSGELSLIKYFSDSDTFLTRVSGHIKYAALNYEINRVVFQKNETIYASDLDLRDWLNEQPIYTGSGITRIFLEKTGYFFAVQEESGLKIFKLR